MKLKYSLTINTWMNKMKNSEIKFERFFVRNQLACPTRKLGKTFVHIYILQFSKIRTDTLFYMQNNPNQQIDFVSTT